MEQPHVVEHFFGVYLLYCENPKYKGRVYIGYTVDPVRRLKRHNAGSKFGGARRTSNRGPWKMVLVVHGFPNSTSALRFEWAWQHPQVSRRLRHVPKKKNSQKMFDYSLNVLAAMLKVGPWSRLPLTLRWLDPEFSKQLLTDIIPPIHMPISYGPVEAKKINKGKKLKKGKDEDPAGEIEENLMADILICDICYMSLIIDDKVDCLKPNCDFMAHLICLASEFNNDDKIIPIEGSCPSCKTNLLWGDVIRKKIGCYLHLDDKSKEESSDDSD